MKTKEFIPVSDRIIEQDDIDFKDPLLVAILVLAIVYVSCMVTVVMIA